MNWLLGAFPKFSFGLGVGLVVLGVGVIGLDIWGPDWIEPISAWGFALPLLGGIALALGGPAMAMRFHLSLGRDGDRNLATPPGPRPPAGAGPCDNYLTIYTSSVERRYR
jgi:hypothetical protein